MEQTTALALPDEQQFKSDIQAINQFQKVVRANMIDGQDFGVIPGTSKPTLLKPGAEKIAKLLGLADHYEILDRQEDWERGFFRYLIKCSLKSAATGVTISEGLGECNSKESKYAYRWVGERDLPPGTDKAHLISQVRHSRSGGRWTVYRLDNEVIFSQVNTLLKMSKKRSLVDAALSAGRLSQVFTQDIEDMAVTPDEQASIKTQPSKKKEPAKVAGQAENEAEDLWPSTSSSKQEAEATAEPTPGQPEPEPAEKASFIDMDWLKESLKTLQDKGIKAYSNKTILSYLNAITRGEYKSIPEAVAKLDKARADEFVKRVQEALDLA